MKFIPEHRPYWHVDAKWVSGIVLMATLAGALLFNTLAVLSNPKNGVEFSATIIASLFSRDGLDAPEDLTDLKKQLAKSPDGTVAPIPNFPKVRISKADVETLSPRELRLKIFRQVAEPIYSKGLEGAAAEVTSDPAEIEKFKKDAFLLGGFTKTTHAVLAGWATILAIISGLALLAVAYFSWGWGRLSNPGALTLAAALPGAFASFVLTHAPGAKDGGLSSMVPPDLVPEIGGAMSRTYGAMALLGLLALLAAGIGRAITHRRAARAILRT